MKAQASSLTGAFAVRSHNTDQYRELEEATDKEPEIWPHLRAEHACLKDY